MTVPMQPKIYHIMHVDRLPSIVADGYLWCDAEIVRAHTAWNYYRHERHQATAP